jgi:ABC-type nitrate/sulfonate/bicarbonate transport system permease component
MIADAGAPVTSAVTAAATDAPPRANRKPKRAWGPIVLPFIAVLLVLGLWEFLNAAKIVNPLVLPSPIDVAKSLVNDRAIYWTNARTTLVEIALGSTIGVSLGVLFGVGVALQRSVRAALYPLLVASQSLPILALAPILVLWLGFGIAPKIVIVVQIIFFPVTVATIQGLTSVSNEVLVFGRSLGASSSTIFWKVRVPAMLPYLFGGLKIASSYAAVAAVIAEYTGAEHGLGALMLRANSDYNIPVVFGAVVVVTIIGLSLFGLTTLAERKLTPWHRGTTER